VHLRREDIDKTNRWVHECIWISSSRAPVGMIIECRQVTSITDQVLVFISVCVLLRKKGFVPIWHCCFCSKTVGVLCE